MVVPLNVAVVGTDVAVLCARLLIGGAIACSEAKLASAANLSGSNSTVDEKATFSLPLLSEPVCLWALAFTVPAVPEDPANS